MDRKQADRSKTEKRTKADHDTPHCGEDAGPGGRTHSKLDKERGNRAGFQGQGFYFDPAGGFRTPRAARAGLSAALLLRACQKADLITRHLCQFFDQIAQLAPAAFAEPGELDADLMVGIDLADGSLDPHRQVAHTEGHFHGFPSAKGATVGQLHQAAAQAQIGNGATRAGARGKAANVHLPAASKPQMLSPILALLLHRVPPRASNPEKNIGAPARCVRSRKNMALLPCKPFPVPGKSRNFVTADTSTLAASRYSVFMAARAAAQSNPIPAERFAPARSLLEQAVRQRAFPGAAWGVLHRGATVAIDAIGRFTYEASAPAIQPETVFDLASLTKVLATTAAAMLLVDRGRLDLDERLGDILPGFVIGMEPGSGKQHVTLRTLLAHTSGLPAYATLFHEYTTPETLLRAALRLPLEAKPGTHTEYSDFGFILLGKVVEVLSGEAFDGFCAREIFAPLGLKVARFCPPPEVRSTIPPTEDDQTFRRRVIQGEVQDENCFVLGGVAGHAGLFANVEDLLHFAECILAQGRTQQGSQLFQPATVAQFATRQGPLESKSRALGWDVPTEGSSSGRYFGLRSIGHLGYSGCSLWIDPDQELAVVLLTNRTWPDRSNDAIRQVRPAFHNAVVESLRG